MIYIISLYYVPGFHIQSCEQNHWILSKTGHSNLLKKKKTILMGFPLRVLLRVRGSLFHSRAVSLQYADYIRSLFREMFQFNRGKQQRSLIGCLFIFRKSQYAVPFATSPVGIRTSTPRTARFTKLIYFLSSNIVVPCHQRSHALQLPCR